MIKHQSLVSPPSFPNTSPPFETMTLEEPEPNPASTDHISDWLDGSISYLPPFLDDPYSSTDIIDETWWTSTQDLDQQLINYNLPTTTTTTPSDSTIINYNTTTITSASASTSTTTTTTTTPTTDLIISNHPPLVHLSKKRKSTTDTNPAGKNQSRRINKTEDADLLVNEQGGPVKKAAGNNRKGTGKSAGSNCNNNGNNKEGRWAEQLLNPCATAITTGNISRVQHLLFVLHELASPTGDANYRLASHGLRALKHHLSSSSSPINSDGAINFATAKPKFFQQSLINFNDNNPWFTIPNNIANSSILQVLSEQDHSRPLHIVDIGVSHGVQWPILLEALSRRSGGPPPLVRLTVVSPTIDNNQITDTTPFATGPPGYNFSIKLLRFAKDININLQINQLDNCPLQNLDSQAIESSPDETLIICAQFRLHYLNHNNQDYRTEFLKLMRSLEPKGVILSENNMDCSCNSCCDFATGFSRRVEYLWSFLDSTSAAFKGRESDERRMMEGEAAKALTNVGEMNERKEKWGDRMRGVGFVGDMFGEDVIDGARALLRKYDNNWEMKIEEKDKCVGLWWKGQPVSFCSLWKINAKCSDSYDMK